MFRHSVRQNTSAAYDGNLDSLNDVQATISMSVLVSVIAVALGTFIATSPDRAARIWGWKSFEKLAPRQRALYLWVFRLLGVLVCLAGILFGADSIWFH